MKYGFEELNLHSIYAKVYDFNDKSKKAAKKSGLKEAGRLRKAVYRHGEYHELIYLDILREEWEEKNLDPVND